MLLMLTGSSCSGKTTVAPACADIDGLVIHDFDEAGVPPEADAVWRQRTLERWVRAAIDSHARGLDLLLTGQSPLGELLATPSAPELDGVAVCLLDVEDEERLTRLRARDPGKWDDDAERSFIEWGRWHREHAADPQARQDVLTADGWEQMRWRRWTDWTAGDDRWCTATIDTTAQSVAQTAASAREWTDRARQRRLDPATS